MAVPGSKLFVGCLPYSATEDDFGPLFEQYGPLQEIVLLRKPDGSSKGAGIITFFTAESAAAAMAALQGYTFPGSPRGLNISIKDGGGGGQMPQQMQQQMPQHMPQQMQQSFAQTANQFGQFVQQPMPSARPTSGKGGQGGQFAAFGQTKQEVMQRGPYVNQRPQGAAAPGTKVFVGQLPYSKSENDLLQLFGSMGPVIEVYLMKDKITGEKKGSAFVRFQSPQHAASACAALEGFLFAGSTRPITVSIAQDGNGPKFHTMPNPAQAISSLGTQAAGAAMVGGFMPAMAHQAAKVEQVEGAKLFVGQLPFSKNETEIQEVFSPYGEVVEVAIHRDAQGQKKGACFVRFTAAEQATMALEMDGYMFQGATRPITVKLAGEGPASKRARHE